MPEVTVVGDIIRIAVVYSAVATSSHVRVRLAARKRRTESFVRRWEGVGDDVHSGKRDLLQRSKQSVT
jgi:hypothetical protein